MTSIAKVFIVVAVTLLALPAIGVTLCYFEVGSRLAAGVTREGLLSLRPEMTEEDVTERVGKPLHKKNAPNREHQEIWVYGEPGPCMEGLEVYVFMKDGQLQAVNVEHFDLGAYSCTDRGCPVIRNSEDFERTFR